ncbi:MAG: polyphosphate polymerase domain-containing protein [Planctomycetales bacterium]|nr:polyphosphate polymerase domain-containing protein [Planctomycetales bacterium]
MTESNSLQNIKNALRQLSPITLAELDRVALMNRVDTKYVISESLLPDVLTAISSDYRVLEIDGVRCAPYATLYFDSPDADCYRDHHNGKERRCKFRMRSYLSSHISFFEVKQRTNKGRTIKSRVPIDEIKSALDDELLEFADTTTGEPMPLESAIWTQFSRITLASEAATERVTIDVNLEFEKGDRSIELPGVAIVEVKQERDSRQSPIRRALREMHVAPLRMSKYCIGSALIDPTLKQNRFKAKLLALRNLIRNTKAAAT